MPKIVEYRPPVVGSGVLELATFAYAALYGGNDPAHRRPTVSSRIPAMQSKGLDPHAAASPAQVNAVPGFATRLAQASWDTLRGGAQLLDAGLRRLVTVQGVGAASPLCKLESNSSLAELRIAVEDMNLVFTSDKLVSINQAADTRWGGGRVFDLLLEMEESVLLEHCVFCLDMNLPDSQRFHLLALIEKVAEDTQRKVVYSTSDAGLAQGSCMSKAGADPCTLVKFDTCKPHAAYADELRNDDRNIPVFVGNSSDVKFIENAYGVLPQNSARTVVAIRNWGVDAPYQRNCHRQPDMPAAPAPLPFGAVFALAVGVPAVVLAAGIGGVQRWNKAKQAKADAATADTVTPIKQAKEAPNKIN